MDERTRLDRTAKRRYEALTSRLDRAVERVAPGVWVTPSRSNPNDFHIVSQQRGELVCDCAGAKAGQPCRHVAAVQLWCGWSTYQEKSISSCRQSASSAIVVDKQGSRRQPLQRVKLT